MHSAPIFGAFGVGMPGNFYEKDGAVVNALYDPAMKDALAFIKQMIASGSVDPELLANSGLQHQEKAIKGQAGIVYIDWPNMTKEQFVEQIKTVNPNAEWLQIAAPSGPGGQYRRIMGYWRGTGPDCYSEGTGEGSGEAAAGLRFVELYFESGRRLDACAIRGEGYAFHP